MCGIAGIVMKDGAPVSRPVLAAMTDALAHRGPDDRGVWVDGHLGLGHRRLAIIDPVGAVQPMCDSSRRVWIAYNGEVYNFRDLRQELEGRGHEFRTRSDTEVVLAAWQEWGASCVERLRGMFALAIVDLDRHTLLLARDHFGIKPLYYLNSPRLFAFASELEALRRLPEVAFDVDLGAIDEYLRLQYIPAPRTAYRQVAKLRPGHRLAVGLDGVPATAERYWQLRFAPEHGRSEDEWLELLDSTLAESVHAHMVADVPFGAFLSGGVDSSAVVAYMARVLQQPVRTFTIGFTAEEHSELRFAEVVAERWHTEHHVEVLSPDACAILPTLVRHYGEPFGDASAIPTYYVSRLARTAVPMVLSGDGGDELFAGYASYREWYSWLTSADAPAWKRWLYPLAQRLRPGRYLPRDPSNLAAWLSFVSWTPRPTRRQLWRPEHRHLADQESPFFAEEFARCAGLHPVQRAQYLDLMTYLPFAILAKVDGASMVSSLEVRTPLVDLRVAELAATIPVELNFRRGADGRYEGKLLLKKLLRRYYPEDFLRRPKTGFGVPLATWLGDATTLRTTVHDRLLSPTSPLAELFEPAAIRALVRNAAHAPVWLLLVLDEWLRQRRERP